MKPEIHLRLYEELSDYLPPDKRKCRFARRLNAGIDVGQLLAELGVPDNLVDLVLVNGNSADFSRSPLAE